MLRRETAGSPSRLERALAGLRRYQEADRAPTPEPPSAIAERLGACVRDYGGEGRPVLFVPSLINPPTILDLSEQRSLLRWLAADGRVRPLLLDWGWDAQGRRDLSVAGHVEEILLPLARDMPERAALAGYCLGGTMALAAAASLGVPVALIAAPWRFSGFPDEARALLAALWGSAEPAAVRLGVLPMEVLQTAFWSLDPARTVAKFEAFATLAEGSEEAKAFVTLEDWANDGPPLPEAASRELFEGLFARDETGRGRWRVEDPATLAIPILNVVSTSDRIVPAASAADAGARLELSQGHVGMVIGSRSKECLWEPLAAWLSRAGASC